MTTTSPTVIHDEQITAAQAEFDRCQRDVQDARDHRQRVREHRLRTIGRTAAERLELPEVDLATLRSRYLDTLHAEQDTGLRSHDARLQLEQLGRARPTVEAGETRAHLAALLNHRAVWAERIDAVGALWVEAVRGYLAIAGECDAMAHALGIWEEGTPDPAGPLVDRMLSCLKTAAPSAFERFAVGPTLPPLAESDQEMTKRVRSRMEVRA